MGMALVSRAAPTPPREKKATYIYSSSRAREFKCVNREKLYLCEPPPTLVLVRDKDRPQDEANAVTTMLYTCIYNTESVGLRSAAS